MDNQTHGYVLGRRVVVYGATGSGKTTLARRLGEALNLAVIEMDAIRHAHGWDSTPWDDFRVRLSDLLDSSPDGWVCDGNYSRIRDVAVSHADTAIWLHLPWRTSFWRVFKRTVTRAWTREPLWGWARESWRMSFLSKNSILWWSISHHREHVRHTREALSDLSPSVRVYELRSAREVEALFASLSGSVSGRPR